MAKQAAPVSLTGGAGFDFEDRVAARFLADMLAGLRTFGEEFGKVVRVDWQTRDAGRLLDDLAVTAADGAARRVAEVSVKSGRQVTSGGFPANFVEAVWEQWPSTESDTFDKDSDLLVLVTGELANDVEEAWKTLFKEASATPSGRLLQRLEPPTGNGGSQMSETARAIVGSLHCPKKLRRASGTDEAATIALIRRIRLIRYDFDSAPSRDWGRITTDCRDPLRTDTPEKVTELCDDLLKIAKRHRPAGGSIDLPALISRLRPKHSLKHHQDYRGDWATLTQLSSQTLDDIRDTIGDGLRIDRTDRIEEFERVLQTSRLCLAAGESGSGKSALAKSFAAGGYDAVVALAPEDLEPLRPGRIAVSRVLSHRIPETLAAAGGNCLLMLDSLEKCSERALREAGRLIAEVAGRADLPHVDVLLLCQFDAVGRVIDRMTEAGVDRSSLAVVPFDAPSAEQVSTLLKNVEGIQWTTLHHDLRPLLRNLKILDWVVRASGAGHGIGQTSPGGLIPLIDYLWERWVESDDRGTAAGNLLKKIAVAEAATFSPDIPLTNLSHSEHQAVPGMMAADLLKRRGERIRLSHDLLGDWSRLKVLAGEDPTRSDESLKRVGSARWHRAVRLFGRWLLSKPGGATDWFGAISRAENDTEHGAVVRDLLLEALVVSENGRELLSEAWPVLVRDDGRLLELLLDRFLFAATLPDLNLPQLTQNEDLTPHLEAALRTPIWPYWKALLPVLDEFSGDICRLVPEGAAKICKIWLEKTLPFAGGDVGAALARPAAARLAMDVAREYQAKSQEGRIGSIDGDQIAYEAALLSAPELPEEVAAFCLEMAGRRPVSKEIQERAETAAAAAEEERQRRLRELGPRTKPPALGTALPLGSLREPWPDGPQRRVDRNFRTAIQSGSAILPLAGVRPDETLELLLATCIEPPRHEAVFFDSGRDDCGIESERVLDPPMHFRGPFLQLFRAAPNLALTFTLRLINFATNRWWEQEERYRQKRGPVPDEWGVSALEDERLNVQVHIEGSIREWAGDRRVFRWHLDWPGLPDLISCILMALEQWLYERLDAEDDVTDTLDRLVAESESVALAGVLVHVGKKQPALFTGSLRPLLGASEFYEWDLSAGLERSSSSFWRAAWLREPERVKAVAEQWHEAPHRRFSLQKIAVWVMFSHAASERFLAVQRDLWVQTAGGADASIGIRMLAASLDRTNYAETMLADGRVQSEFVPPRDLAKQIAAEADETDASMALLTFPMQCRQIIDGDAKLLESECEGIWLKGQQIEEREPRDDDEASRRAAAIAGTAAVLLNAHPEWTRDEPERLAWCVSRLQELVENPPARGRFDVPEAAGSWDWEYFAAEAGVRLLCFDREDAFARTLVADGVIAFHYETTRRVMALAYRLRPMLELDFEAMQRLAVYRSTVRRVLSHIRSHPEVVVASQGGGRQAARTKKRLRRLEREFDSVQERLEGVRQDFLTRQVPDIDFAAASKLGRELGERVNAVGREEEENLEPGSGAKSRASRRRTKSREELWLDLKVLEAAFSWLDVACSEEGHERRCHLPLVTGFRDLLLSRLQEAPDAPQGAEEYEGLPDEFDGWVYGLMARYIVRADKEESLNFLWEPLLRLDPLADKWVARFYWYWFSNGVAAAPNPLTFTKRWSEMIDFALTSEQWDPSVTPRYGLSDRVSGLLGFELSLNAAASDPAYADAVGRLRPHFERAAQRWFKLSDVAVKFTASLSQPAYAPFLRPGICWIHQAMQSSDQRRFWQRRMSEYLVSALHRCWDRHADDVKAGGELQTAFNELLTALTSRGDHAAMALRERVLNSIPNRQ